MRPTRKYVRDARRGATVVEAAIVLPLFVLLILGMIDLSRVGMASQLLANATLEGCRVAVISGATQADVQNRVNTMLAGSGISGVSVTPTCPSPHAWNTAPMGTPITVSVSVPFSQVTWLGSATRFPSAVLSASATLSSERP